MTKCCCCVACTAPNRPHSSGTEDATSAANANAHANASAASEKAAVPPAETAAHVKEEAETPRVLKAAVAAAAAEAAAAAAAGHTLNNHHPANANSPLANGKPIELAERFLRLACPSLGLSCLSTRYWRKLSRHCSSALYHAQRLTRFSGNVYVT